MDCLISSIESGSKSNVGCSLARIAMLQGHNMMGWFAAADGSRLR
jgi:hypothetical protein